MQFIVDGKSNPQHTLENIMWLYCTRSSTDRASKLINCNNNLPMLLVDQMKAPVDGNVKNC
jgi:hypothetical protein